MPAEWEHMQHSDGRTSARALAGRWRLSVWDHTKVRPDAAEPVRWYVAHDGIYFDRAQGAARTADEGKAAAIAAAEELEGGDAAQAG